MIMKTRKLELNESQIEELITVAKYRYEDFKDERDRLLTIKRIDNIEFWNKRVDNWLDIISQLTKVPL